MQYSTIGGPATSTVDLRHQRTLNKPVVLMHLSYHEYFILMFDIAHRDHQRCKTFGHTIKENGLIVRLWLLKQGMTMLQFIHSLDVNTVLHETGPSMSTRMCSVAVHVSHYAKIKKNH